MRGRKAALINLTPRQATILQQIISARKTEKRFYQRAMIIVEASKGITNTEITKSLKMHYETIMHWRNKWFLNQEALKISELESSDADYFSIITELLSDEERPGTPCKFTPEQVCQIMSVACEEPELSKYPVSHWSAGLLAEEVKKRGIVESISKTQVGRFLKSGRHKTA